MHPILLEIGSLTLYTYGLFVALGFIFALWFAKRNASAHNVCQDTIADLFFVILISALAGARLLYVIIGWESYKDNLLDIFKIWNGGLVFFGGFLGATAAAILFCRVKRLAAWQIADILAPALALGHGIGRFGCLFAGCCYGKVCDLPFAIRFTHPQSLAPLNVALHPTQIYMVVSNLVLFFILLGVQKHKRFDGMVFLSYVMLYSAFRSGIEFFRGDFRGDFIFDFISLSQGIGFVVSVLALGLMILRLRSGRASN